MAVALEKLTKKLIDKHYKVVTKPAPSTYSIILEKTNNSTSEAFDEKE